MDGYFAVVFILAVVLGIPGAVILGLAAIIWNRPLKIRATGYGISLSVGPSEPVVDGGPKASFTERHSDPTGSDNAAGSQVARR